MDNLLRGTDLQGHCHGVKSHELVDSSIYTTGGVKGNQALPSATSPVIVFRCVENDEKILLTLISFEYIEE